MKMNNIIPQILAVCLFPGSAPAAEFFNGATPVTAGGIDITNGKLPFSDVSQAVGNRARNITLADGRLPGTMSNKTLPSAMLTNTTCPVSVQSGTVLDFACDSFKVCTLSTNTIVTTANLAAGKSLTVRITGGASVWSTTFPAWAFVGASAPSNIAIGKVGILTIASFGTTDADCVAAFAVQP